MAITELAKWYPTEDPDISNLDGIGLCWLHLFSWPLRKTGSWWSSFQIEKCPFWFLLFSDCLHFPFLHRTGKGTSASCACTAAKFKASHGGSCTTDCFWIGGWGFSADATNGTDGAMLCHSTDITKTRITKVFSAAAESDGEGGRCLEIRRPVPWQPGSKSHLVHQWKTGPGGWRFPGDGGCQQRREHADDQRNLSGRWGRVHVQGR